MEADWFIHEVSQRTRHCNFPPLVTTCTDGENGGWFRNTSPEANFWSVFYQDLLRRTRDNRSDGIHPCFIDDYLDRHGSHGEVTVRPGAWNTGWHDGSGFVQWVGSPAQQAALTRLDEISQAIYAARRNAIGISVRDPERVPAPRGSPLAGSPGRDQLQLLLGRSLAAALPRRPRPGHPFPEPGGITFDVNPARPSSVPHRRRPFWPA